MLTRVVASGESRHTSHMDDHQPIQHDDVKFIEPFRISGYR
jgi:hypothetical protein